MYLCVKLLKSMISVKRCSQISWLFSPQKEMKHTCSLYIFCIIWLLQLIYFAWPCDTKLWTTFENLNCKHFNICYVADLHTYSEIVMYEYCEGQLNISMHLFHKIDIDYKIVNCIVIIKAVKISDQATIMKFF